MRLVFTLTLAALAVVATSTASAQRRPQPPQDRLERYSDASLLRELEYRGYSCEDSQSHGATVLVLTCNQLTEMIFELYTEGGSKISSSKVFFGSSSKCEAEKARIVAETGTRIRRPKAVAYCNQLTEVVKLQVTPEGVRQTEKTFTGSDSLCQSQAQAFNDMF